MEAKGLSHWPAAASRHWENKRFLPSSLVDASSSFCCLSLWSAGCFLEIEADIAGGGQTRLASHFLSPQNALSKQKSKPMAGSRQLSCSLCLQGKQSPSRVTAFPAHFPRGAETHRQMFSVGRGLFGTWLLPGAWKSGLPALSCARN